MADTLPQYSIVTTLYNFADIIPRFCERVQQVMEGLGVSYEIVLVNDGSTDDSDQVMQELLQQMDHLVYVPFTRNFGHHPAVMAGLDQARGERVFMLDGDLEEDPGWLPDFIKMMDAENVDVVYGQQRQRKGGWFERASGSLFYRMFNWFSEVRIPDNACIARLMTRAYVDAVLRLKDRNVFFPGMFFWVGFKQKPIPVDKGSRESGSSYTFLRRVQLMGTGIASFSSRPLVMIFVLGCILSALSGSYGLFVVAKKLIQGEAVVSGWTSMMVSLWFLGGIIIMMIGIVGLYIAKIFNEVKIRPNYVIRSVHRSRQASEPDQHTSQAEAISE